MEKSCFYCDILMEMTGQQQKMWTMSFTWSNTKTAFNKIYLYLSIDIFHINICVHCSMRRKIKTLQILFALVRFGSFRLLFFQLTTLHTHTYFNSLFILCLFIYFKLNYWFYGNRRNCSSPFLCTTTINMTLQKHMNWKKNLFIWKKCHANTAEVRERERKGSIEFYEA